MLRGDTLNRGLAGIILHHPGIDPEKLPVQLAQIRLQYSGFLAHTLHEIIERVVIGEIKIQMRLHRVHEKIINGTRIARVYVPKAGHIRYTIQSSYKAASGFNVAVMIERGRQPYVVYPVRAPALRWVDKLTGIIVFAQRSSIPPYPGKHIVADTVRSAQPRVQAELDEATEVWIRSILGL